MPALPTAHCDLPTPLRLIQAGVGGMGGTWVNALRGRADVNVVALVDIADAPLADAGETLGVPADRRFKDLATAVDAVDADAVLTVTPPAVHVRHAEVAFARGLHVLTEKPIAATMAEAVRMTRLADDAGKVLMVAQNYRYHPPMATLARLAKAGGLGRLGSGHVDFYLRGDFRGSFRQTMPYPLLVDMAIHHLDLVRAVTGRDIDRVTADSFDPPGSHYDHDCGLKLLMRLDDGTPFGYSGDWAARGRGTTWNGAWHLQFEHGCLELTKGGRIVRSTSGFWKEDVAEETVAEDKGIGNAQGELMTRFVDACRTGTPPETSGRDNLWSFGAVTAAVASAEARRAVRVADVLVPSPGTAGRGLG